MFFCELLLDSDIFMDLMIWVEMSLYYRVCVIGIDQIVGGNMLFLVVCMKNDMLFIIFMLDFSVQVIVINFNVGGDQ